MSQSIMFSNYKFVIELSNTSVNIKVFNTITSEIYNGSVNENEIYVQPIEKFLKLLSNGLNKEKDFSISIMEALGKIKCNLSYKTDFFELEEVFSLNQIHLSPHEIHNIELEQKIINLNKCLDDNQCKFIELESKLEKYKQADMIISLRENDIKIKAKILEEKEIESHKRIKIMEDQLEDKKREFKIELNKMVQMPKVADFSDVFTEQNKLKGTTYKKFMELVLTNNFSRQITDKEKDCINNIINNEYIVSKDSNSIITNYGKIFLGVERYYCVYCDLKIPYLNKNIIDIIKSTFIIKYDMKNYMLANPNTGCCNGGTVLYEPPIIKDHETNINKN